MTFRVLELDRRLLPKIGDVVRAEVNGRGQHIIGTYDGVHTGDRPGMCWVVDDVRNVGDERFPDVGGAFFCHADSVEVIS